MGGAERRPLGDRAADDRRRALDALLRPNLAAAVRFARGLGLPHADAEDCVQRALLSLLRQPKDLPGPAAVRAWLFRAVALEARMARRQDRRRRAREAGAARASVVETTDRLLGAEVEAALSTLPPDERQAVVLRFLHDLDYREIARRVGASPLACRLRVHRGVRRLRRRFGSHAPLLLFLGLAPARSFALGGLLMTTASKVAFGTGIALSVAALLVGGASLLQRNEGPPPRRAVRTEEAPAAPEEAPASEEPPFDAAGAARAIERANAAARPDGEARSKLSELEAGMSSLEAGMKAIEASEAGPEKRPDAATRRYLDELADAYRRLPPGDERARVLENFADAYAKYARATGEREFDPFVLEVLDRSGEERERRSAGRALVGIDPPGDRVLRFLEHPSPHVRRPAVLAAPWVRGGERSDCRERLYPALDDDDRMVRCAAAIGLAAVEPGPRTLDALCARLAREEDPTVAQVLGRSIRGCEGGEARLGELLPALRPGIRDAAAGEKPAPR